MNKESRFVNTQSTQALQKKIRSLKRFTTDPPSNVPATHLEEANRALKKFESDLRSLKVQRRNEKLSQQYRMVRFFERKKAEKRLRQAQQALRQWTQESGESEEGIQQGASLREAVVRAETDVEWVKSPVWDRGSRYIALYAGEQNDFNRPEQWWAIKAQLESESPRQGIKWPDKIQIKAGKIMRNTGTRTSQAVIGLGEAALEAEESESPYATKAKSKKRMSRTNAEARLEPEIAARDHSPRQRPHDGRHRDKPQLSSIKPEEGSESDGGFFE